MVFDFKIRISRAQVDHLSQRASPHPLSNIYKLAKLLISIGYNTTPLVLFHETLTHAVTERRAEAMPNFLYISHLGIRLELLQIPTLMWQIKSPSNGHGQP